MRNWMEENTCPWCGKLYSEVDHYLGCPEPDPEVMRGPRAQKLLAFNEYLYSDCPKPWDTPEDK